MAGMRYQPQGRVAIDWSNPITRGLAFAFVHGPAQASGFMTGAGPVSFAYSSTARALLNPKGGAVVVVTPAAGGAYDALIDGTILGGSYSLLAVASTSDLSGTTNAIDSDGWSARRFQFRLNAGKVELITFNSGASPIFASQPSALSAAEAARGFVMGATATPQRIASWQNGRKQLTNTAGTIAPDMPVIVGAYRGQGTPTNGNWATGGVNLAAGWSRELSDDEMRSLAANPWQLFADPADDDDYVAAAGAPVQAYALAATAATFGLSGASIRLLAARQIAVGSAALARSDFPAGLAAARRLASAVGSLLVSPSQAGILALRRLAPAAGAFALSAVPAGVCATRRLAAAAGAFAMSPTGVQFSYTPQQQGGGTAYVLSALPGAFDLVGPAASLRALRRVSGAAGEFLLTGAPARLLFGRRLAASSGSVVATGAGAGLGASRRIPAQAGMYALTTAAAPMRYSAQVEYARAPAGSGYAPQSRYNEARPAATSSPRPAATQRNYR